ncbi:MAG TPA: proton-conducting transporter membrane subunit, partial [Thermoleophilia bacterium]|nr:proton-conducting transporter membrane subunit [Thermoleophilia bacterium]
MSEHSLELWAIIPELILAGVGLVLVPVAAFVHGRGYWRYVPAAVATAALLGALVSTARMLGWEDQAVFSDTYALDGFAHVFKLILETGGLLGLLMITAHFRGRDQVVHAPMAVLFVTLGGLGLASALDLGLIVLFLQMLSLPAYLLVTLVRADRRSNEATLKYFVYGAAAMAIMAYGLTFLYGMTGTLELRAIGRELAAGADQVWIALALGLILIGYGFEMTMVPFHFWAPDVYSGAPAPVTGFISVVPKVAGFAAFLRFALLAYRGEMGGWPTLVAILAV